MKFFLIGLVVILLVEFVLSSVIFLKERDECLTGFHGTGNCKIASNCEWIQDNDIQESDWVFCDTKDKEVNPLICCKDPLTDSETSSTVAPDLTTTTEAPSLNLQYDKIYSTDEECQQLHQEYMRLKGVDLPHGIANGKNAERREFPFVVSIETLESNGSYVHKCGGSIITRRHILTAAHCINFRPEEYPENARIRYGSFRSDEGMIEVKLAKPPHSHPAYQNHAAGSDIAIFFLEDDIEINGDAMPVCLYHGNEPLELESNATITGFGLLVNGSLPDILQKAQINIKDAPACASLFKNTRNTLLDTQICAGDSNIQSDTCQGDSGGPLLQMFDERKTLIGLTSFGPDACKPNNVPGVYTRVSSFLEWIGQVITKDFSDLIENNVEINVNKRNS